ncbi:hypothetical protein EN873_39115 [bacterium M00.F.Ca.ET.230.01.1.1]|nr:hypothetical protein EN873_39115 [bacterium M00.F.Ca.ET.230.01.1.1]
MTVFLQLGFGLMALEREFVSEWKLSSRQQVKPVGTPQATMSSFACNVTGLTFPCNATETMIDHLDRHHEGGGIVSAMALTNQG